MKNKINIYLNMIIICLSLYVISVGVYSITSAQLTITGSLGYIYHPRISTLSYTWSTTQESMLFSTSDDVTLSAGTIKSIVFTIDDALLNDYTQIVGLNLKDASSTYPILVYYKVSTEDATLYDVIIYSEVDIYAPTSCYRAFYNWSNCASITFDSFDTSNVTNMSNMFLGCSSLTNLDLSSFNTKKVENMFFMFGDCSSLNNLDLSSFDTSNVNNMSRMFDYCQGLTDIDLSVFNTSKVTNMSNMFASCDALTSLDLSSFNTEKVENMSTMFRGCTNLNSLKLSSFNTSKVTNMSSMFHNCSALVDIDVRNFNTSKVTNMSNMFFNCNSLLNLVLINFETDNVTDMSYMFAECSSLTKIYASKDWYRSSGLTSNDMFYYCKSLVGENGTVYDSTNTTATYAHIDTADAPGYFSAPTATLSNTWNSTTAGAGGLFDSNASLGLSKFNIETITFTGVEPSGYTLGTGYNLFAEDSQSTISVYSKANSTSGRYDVVIYSPNTMYAPESCSGAFRSWINCTDITFDNFDTSNVTDMSSMFSSCLALTILDLSGFDTIGVSNMKEMFYNCYNLTTIYATTWHSAGVTSSDMFYGCESLVGRIKYSSSKTTAMYANTLSGYFTKK